MFTIDRGNCSAAFDLLHNKSLKSIFCGTARDFSLSSRPDQQLRLCRGLPARALWHQCQFGTVIYATCCSHLAFASSLLYRDNSVLFQPRLQNQEEEAVGLMFSMYSGGIFINWFKTTFSGTEVLLSSGARIMSPGRRPVVVGKLMRTSTPRGSPDSE